LGCHVAGSFTRKLHQTTSTQTNQRPNILFIVSEDNGPDLGCYGAPVNTPVLDALAEGGIRFNNAYVSQAGCSPSRASFLTGLYPHQNGQVGLATWRYRMYNENTPNLVNDLKASGYRTGIIGKLHVNPERAFDFDFSEIPSGNFARRNLDMYAKHAYDFFTSTDEPFYLQVNYPDAHTPFIPQVDGRPKKIMTGADVDAMPLFGVTSDSLQQITADYYNCIMRLDEMIGELLDNLQKAGKYDNTLIIYIGDHGIDVIRGKRTCYEGGVRIPFIVSWPASGTAGIVSEHMVSIIDIYPTFMDISGSPIPAHLPGKSFLPLLTGGDYEPREYLFTEFHVHSNHNPYPQRAVRDARYKLIYSPLHGTEHPDYAYTLSRKLDGEDFKDALTRAPEFVRQSYQRYHFPPEYELFDLLADPLEWHNLAEVPAYSKVLEHLKKVLREWQVETSDPMVDTGPGQALFR
jgi:N-sulfoglucosamine sulfohydrolase